MKKIDCSHIIQVTGTNVAHHSNFYHGASFQSSLFKFPGNVTRHLDQVPRKFDGVGSKIGTVVKVSVNPSLNPNPNPNPNPRCNPRCSLTLYHGASFQSSLFKFSGNVAEHLDQVPTKFDGVGRRNGTVVKVSVNQSENGH